MYEAHRGRSRGSVASSGSPWSLVGKVAEVTGEEERETTGRRESLEWRRLPLLLCARAVLGLTFTAGGCCARGSRAMNINEQGMVRN